METFSPGHQERCGKLFKQTKKPIEVLGSGSLEQPQGPAPWLAPRDRVRGREAGALALFCCALQPGLVSGGSRAVAQAGTAEEAPSPGPEAQCPVPARQGQHQGTRGRVWAAWGEALGTGQPLEKGGWAESKLPWGSMGLGRSRQVDGQGLPAVPKVGPRLRSSAGLGCSRPAHGGCCLARGAPGSKLGLPAHWCSMSGEGWKCPGCKGLAAGNPRGPGNSCCSCPGLACPQLLARGQGLGLRRHCGGPLTGGYWPAHP